MKKIVFVVMAVAAIGFTSCGNKTQQAEAVDSVAIVDWLVLLPRVTSTPSALY